ncbi:hypothetical protein [Pseudomonas ogarae]|uniref:hypothetical protein n=1 Tax=Pseudomonas ogarae (strain DSM 112162 / CECT 30235 / F113) TaxID=1114970 RepID=UPI00194DE894|nr:hypothetical protein [Pseudomonas ogarae]
MSHAADIRATYFELNGGGIFSKDPTEHQDVFFGSASQDFLNHMHGVVVGRESSRHASYAPLASSPLDTHSLHRMKACIEASSTFSASVSKMYVMIASESIESMYRVSLPVEQYIKEARWHFICEEISELSNSVSSAMGLTSNRSLGYASKRFERAFDRLISFVNEELDWDSCGGRPASAKVYAETLSFLYEAEEAGVVEPSLALGNDGSVAAVWQNDEWYITAVFSGVDDYIFVVSQIPEIVASGSHSGTGIAAELIKYLSEYSREDGKFGL